LAAITASYSEQQDVLYGAARGWVDRMVDPVETRRELGEALMLAGGCDTSRPFATGVLQT
ncbi:MAG: acyl-CoA carboxylase subunit beta, partial [Phycisphaeraceae bacterium]|nr:acyl-CoA carboxylase subunit beta [Phycisphaeraceae bacterium]